MNFEFPSFIVEYIHRAGRVGRLSSKKPGTVTNLISGRNEVFLVQKIEVGSGTRINLTVMLITSFLMMNFILQIAVRTMTELENVNPNIKRIINYRRASDMEKKLGMLH